MRPADRYEYIDVIRGIAIFGVIAGHVARHTPHLPRSLEVLTNMGQFGVPLFFVASAFTLFMSYDRHAGEPGSLKAFFVRRYFRIAPMYYFGILFYALVRWLGDTPFPENYGRDAGLNFLLLHGVVPSALGGVVPGGWSIGVEILFYLLLPSLAFLVTSGSRVLWGYVAALVLTACWHLTLPAWTSYFGSTEDARVFLYSWLANHLPVFLSGAIAYYCARQNAAICGWLARNRLGGWTLAFILLVAAKAVGSFAYFWSPTAFAVFFVVLMLLLKAHLPAWMRVAFTQMGVLSFSIYVLHFFVDRTLTTRLCEQVQRIVGTGTAGATLSFGLALLAVTFVSMAASYVTWRWWEKPWQRFGAKLLKP